MPKKASSTVICALISELRSCVEEAIVVAEAADRLAKRGQAEKALRMLMDVEGPTREVQDLFRTALSPSNLASGSAITHTALTFFYCPASARGGLAAVAAHDAVA